MSLLRTRFHALAIVILTQLCFALPVSVAVAQDSPPSELLLPSNTKAWVSIPDFESLKTALDSTKFGAMAKDENLKPFVDEITNQFKSWLNDQNVQFGLKVTDLQGVSSGEICIAGILKEAPAGVADTAPEHAVVLLLDVNGTQEALDELLQKVEKELTDRNAEREDLDVDGIKVTKWSFEKPQGLREKQFAYHGVAGNWFVACDNEGVFRDTIARVVAVDQHPNILANTEAFTKITEQCQFENQSFENHVRWFIEPFGYVQLAQAIAEAKNGVQPVNDTAGLLEEQGFSAIKGIGGVVCVAAGQHEVVHRAFVYAPRQLDDDTKYELGAAILDFRNKDQSELHPPIWVPEESAGYMSLTWDLSNALIEAGHIVDAFGTPGSWERTLEDMKKPDGPGGGVDLEALVNQLENRLSMITTSEMPLDENSERVLFGIKVTGDVALVAESVKRLVLLDAVTVVYNDVEIHVVDTTKEEEDPDFEGLDDVFDEEFGFGDESEGDEEEIEEPKPLFEKRVFAVKDDYLLIANDEEFIKKIIDRIEDAKTVKLLGDAEDYIRVNEALDELIVPGAPSMRHFGRLDKALQTNYEMMRQGKMGQSKTMIAQLLNRAMVEPDAPEDYVREQQIDGSSMPEDYENEVAKYFGPSGLIIQTLEDGWLLTGCVLPRNPKEEPVEEPVDDTDQTEK